MGSKVSEQARRVRERAFLLFATQIEIHFSSFSPDNDLSVKYFNQSLNQGNKLFPMLIHRNVSLISGLI